MNTTRFLTPALMLALAFAPACKKNSDDTTDNPDTTGGDVASDGGGEDPDVEPEPVEPALPEQDPDPAEIDALYQRYLKGDYDGVSQEAEDLRAGLTEDTQIRAHALASSIAALAEAETVPESAKDASEQALADGERLDDPQVRQLAHIAHATYLVRVHEAPAGQAELEAALELGGPYDSLNHLMLAEAHLNQAFGTGDEDMKIKDPARLDQAQAEYEAALTKADALLLGHAQEGLAAIGKYKRDKDMVCEHAQLAEDAYAAAGATEYIREVPALLAKDSRCKDFKKAE